AAGDDGGVGGVDRDVAERDAGGAVGGDGHAAAGEAERGAEDEAAGAGGRQREAAAVDEERVGVEGRARGGAHRTVGAGRLLRESREGEGAGRRRVAETEAAGDGDRHAERHGGRVDGADLARGETEGRGAEGRAGAARLEPGAVDRSGRDS